MYDKSKKDLYNDFSINYDQFLVVEKMWEELFNEIRKNAKISEVIRYSKYLKEIRKEAFNTGRNVYVDLVGYINRIEIMYREKNGWVNRGILLPKQNIKVEKISIIAKSALNKKIHFNSLLMFCL